jgi:hypothetical protein
MSSGQWVPGRRWVVVMVVLALGCGAKNIKKPSPDPDEDEPDAEVTPPPTKVDSAAKPGTLTDGPPPAADVPPPPKDGPPADTGPDGPIECIPACGTDQVCNNGQCESVCAASQTVCKSGCADVATDPRNCGRCEKSCLGSEYCSKGLCVTACAQGETKCGQSCVNLGTDRANCGVCGKACAGAEECMNGFCKCTSPNKVCDGTCQSLTNNRSNCGACGTRCVNQLVCKTRECGCSGSKQVCPNMPTVCVSNLNDCCPGDSVWCNDHCVNLKTDNNNCGSCGKNCSSTQRCSGGTCGCPSTAPRACPGNLCLPAGQCCLNETKCGDKCIAKTADSCCPSDPNPCGDDTKMCNASNRCVCVVSCPGGACVRAGQCCLNETKCGDKCIAKTADSCCPSDTNPCGDDTKMCNATNRCVCVVTCPNNQKCAAKLADCCPSGEDLCGTGCCGPPNMCVGGSCKPPALDPDAGPGPDSGP